MGKSKHSRKRQTPNRPKGVFPPISGGSGASSGVSLPDVQAVVPSPPPAPSALPEYISDSQALIYRIVDAILAGVDTLEGLVANLGLDPKDERNLQEVDVLLRLPEVQNNVYQARRDVTTHVVERFKRDAPLYVEVVREIAFNRANSTKTRLAAAQDALNRAGTGASQKISIDTPSAYAKRLEQLLEPEGKQE